MPWIDEENLDIFTKNEFSTIAIIDSRDKACLVSTSSLSTLTGIFDENYQDMFGDYSEGRKFCFQVQSHEVVGANGRSPLLSRGDRLTIYGKNYQIVSFQPKHDGKLTDIVLKQDFS